ncbi:MAG: thermonuclease family protein [Pseudomonadota bacterium]
MIRASLFLALASTVALSACGSPGYVASIPTRAAHECGVTEVVDGDTIRLLCAQGEVTARLMGYDTPETFRPGCRAEARAGARATAFLDDTLRTAEVIAPRVHGHDRYDRPLVALTIDGEALHKRMIEAGHAVPYSGGQRIDWCAHLRS